MLDRLHFLVVYVGSAAMVAFLAACLSSPEIATFKCHASDTSGAERCELAAMLAVVSEAGEMNPEDLTPAVPSQASATAAAAAH